MSAVRGPSFGSPSPPASRPPASAWEAWSDAEWRLLAAAIIAVARDLSRQVPAPRGAPYYGLDTPDGNLVSLSWFGARGIFRKYESVLELGSGLGAGARWWSAHFGCRVTGVERVAARAAAATRLSARMGDGGQTRFFCAAPAALPCRSGAFTHVWCSDGSAAGGAGPVWREVLRVLRPGGGAAVQWVGAPAADAARAVVALREAGFVGVEARTAEGSGLGEAARLARVRLLRHLEAAADPGGPALAAALGGMYGSRAALGTAVTHVFARRPSAG